MLHSEIELVRFAFVNLYIKKSLTFSFEPIRDKTKTEFLSTYFPEYILYAKLKNKGKRESA
jgi:hypothetical protein